MGVASESTTDKGNTCLINYIKYSNIIINVI